MNEDTNPPGTAAADSARTTRLKAVVFDWAGTMIDFGSFAPMGVFVKAFEQFGVPVTIDQAREPMGLPKWDHIHAMMQVPAIAQAWSARHGATPGRSDVDMVYEVFVPMNEAVVADYATLIPGARETVQALRARDLKVGSTTGYTRSIMQNVLPLAADQGYVPDNLVCSDDMPHGRPTPMNMYRCFVELDVWPAQAVLKVDDTVPGIAEGVAAGCPTVGLALSGNEAGLTPEQFAAMSESDKEPIRERTTKILKDAGADHVIDTVADLVPLLERLGWV